MSELEINFEKITEFKHIISIPEEILIQKIFNLISRMKIESTKEYSIKQNAYDWVKSALLEIKQIINDNPTFLSIDSILPIIDKWLLSTSRRIHSRISAILPKLRANLNPETILLNDNIGVINVEIENLGADIGEDVSCEISIKDLDSNQIYNNNNNDIGNIDQNSNFTWNLEIERDLLIPHLDKELLFSIQPNCKFRGDSVQCPEFIGSIAIRESINLSEEDIIWDETQTDVPENLFKGREGLLNELKYHYKSTNRNRTKVLYGMSRHGKTSLQNYLANILKDEEISIDSKKKTIFPIYWDFSTATGQEKSNDFWHNLLIGGEDLQQTRINGIIEAFKSYYPDLYNKSVQIKNIHMKSSIRFKHFIEIITEINDLGLYPLIVIDEFETIKSVMPDNEKDKNAILSWERLHVFRQMSLKNQASFIFAGQHESLDIIESGYRASFTNCDPIHVGVIDRQSATEIITAQPKIEFNKEAINAILIGSNNLPWAIQLICRRCGIYAVQNQRDLIGPNEVEHIIKILCGEIESDTLGIGKLEAQLASVVYRKNEYIHNAILTIFAHKTHSFEDWIEESEFETIWSEHFTKYTNHSKMTKRKQNALDQLIQRKVIQEESSDGIYKYKISMELFRRLWKVKNPHMKRYLDKILDADEQYSKEVYSL